MTRFYTTIFLVLQHACPPEFRREYGRAMHADFTAALRDETVVHGSLGACTFACDAYLDLLLSALREYAAMLYRDLVFALRSLRKTPLFAVIVVATLALAIGANATVFSILRAVVLAPLPYAAAEALVTLEGTAEGNRLTLSLPDFIDARELATSFERAAAFRPATMTLTNRGRPARLHGILTTDGLFETLGMRPELGRFPSAADSRAGAARVVVISSKLWESAFGGDASVLGKPLMLDGRAYRIVGVAPRGFEQPEVNRGFAQESFWIPLEVRGAGWQDQRGAHLADGIARLRSGIPLATANAELAAIGGRLAARYPATDKAFGFVARPLVDSLVGGVRPVLFALLAAVASVLLVACANVANLLLSRAASRRRELAVRAALGASRGRIVTQLLTETFVLAAAGGALGIALAQVSVRAFVALHPPGIPRVEHIAFDTPAAFYTLGIVGFCTLAAGLVPALAITRSGLDGALKAAGRGGDGSRGKRARSALVVAEVALTLALVVAAGLVTRSFVVLTREPLGFETRDVTVADPVDLPDARYGSDAAKTAFYRRSRERVRALPGVFAAGWSLTPPFSRNRARVSFTIAGARPPQPGEEPSADFNAIDAGFFPALRVSLLAGRNFDDHDRAGSTPVVVVNAAFAKAYFPHGGALGRAIVPGLSTDARKPPPRTIVGIVADTRTTYAKPPAPTLYLAAAQVPIAPLFLVVRSKAGTDAGSAAAAVVPLLDPLLPLPHVQPLRNYLADDTAATRLSVVALGALACVALVLSVAGVFAIVSYGVEQRTHEFGIRMALGARSSHIVRQVIADALRTAALGILFGLIFAALAAHLLADQLYRIPPLDPATFASVSALVAVAALVAALLPARRATRVDPIVALRYE